LALVMARGDDEYLAVLVSGEESKGLVDGDAGTLLLLLLLIIQERLCLPLRFVLEVVVAILAFACLCLPLVVDCTVWSLLVCRVLLNWI